MTAKQYLRQVKRLDNIINAKLEQIEKLRAMSINISRVMSPAQNPVTMPEERR